MLGGGGCSQVGAGRAALFLEEMEKQRVQSRLGPHFFRQRFLKEAQRCFAVTIFFIGSL